MYRRKGYNSYEDNGWFEVFVIVMICVVLIAVAFVWTNHDDAKVDDQIEECLEAGGTPIVVGHQYSSEFKGCTDPKED